MKLLIVYFFILTLLQGQANAESWRSLTPLSSSRHDVEELLGPPQTEPTSFLAEYKLKDEIVTINYASRALCADRGACRCLVADDTVVDISVRPKQYTSFKALGLDKARFTVFPDAENTNNDVYSDRVEGMVYVVSRAEDRIEYVQYGPTAKQCTAILHAKE